MIYFDMFMGVCAACSLTEFSFALNNSIHFWDKRYSLGDSDNGPCSRVSFLVMEELDGTGT